MRADDGARPLAATPGAPPSAGSPPGRSPAGAAPARRGLPLRRKLLFSAVVTIVALLLAEGAGRLLGFPTGEVRSPSKIAIDDPEVLEQTVGIWRPGARVGFFWPPELAFEVEINSLGLRGPEIPLEHGGATRILCLGDSTTFGVYVDEQETWPRRLEGLLRADGLDVEVVNAGGPGWSTADEARLLVERAGELAPDVVLLLVCGNDPGDIRDPEGRHGRLARQLDRARNPNALKRGRDWLCEHTALGELGARLATALRRGGDDARPKPEGNGPGGAPLSPVTSEQWQRFRQAYARIARWCRDRDAHLVTACFPHHPLDGPPGITLEKAVRPIVEAEGGTFIPIGDAVRAVPELHTLYNLPHDLHASAQGNARIAELVRDRLRDRHLPPYAH